MDSYRMLGDLLTELKLSNIDPKKAEIVGADPCFNTPFRVSEAAAAILAGHGLLINNIWTRMGHAPQDVKVEVMAAGLSTAGVFMQSQHGYPIPVPDPDYPTVGFYPTRDGRQILLHGGYPKLRDGTIELLRCSDSRSSIANTVARWDSQDLEDTLADRGLTGAIARTYEEWLAHPQGQAVAASPIVEIIKLDETKPIPFPKMSARPLSSIKVLDFTHVIAGPTCGKTLALFGAEVLHIFCPTRPRLPPFDIDTGHGKLNALLDLKRPQDKLVAERLVKDADVFSQSYRPGKFTSLGFSPQGIAAMKPGIIVVSTSCYGHEGPWHFRPGFEQLAQSATGMAVTQGSIDSPQLGPTFPNDYLTGYLSALGTLAALIRRSEEGGSYHVRVSLSRSATWLQSLGTVDTSKWSPDTISPDYIKRYMTKELGPLGVLEYFSCPLRMSDTPPRFDRPAAPLGTHFPAWARDQEAAQKAALA